jgi:hypothetical protein
MGLMLSDVAEWSLLLVAHGCQAMPFFAWKLAESLALISSKSGPKFVAFEVMKPYQYQLLSDP